MKDNHSPQSAADVFRSLSLPDVCTVEDLAGHFRMSRTAVRLALREGRIPGRRCGRRWLVSRRALLEWLSCTGPGEPSPLQTARADPESLRILPGKGRPSIPDPSADGASQ